MKYLPRAWAPRSAIILLALSPTLAITGCSDGRDTGTGGQGSTLAVPPAVRDSAGIRIVENTEPQWGPGSEWRIGSLLTSIGDATKGLSHELYRARDAIRQSDGTVVVVNSDSGELRFFDRAGTFLRTVGSTGGGPGEFRGASALRALARVPGDTLIAWDIYGQRASVFSPHGSFVRSFGLDASGEQLFFVGIFADRSLLMKVYRHADTESRESMPEGVIRTEVILHRFNTDHQLSHTLPGALGSDQFQARWGDYGMMFADAPFGRVTSVVVGGATAYVSTGDTNEILVYGQSGALETSIRRLLEPLPVSARIISRDRAARIEDEKELEESQTEPRVMRMIAELPYPEVIPPYGLTVLDSELNLWVEDYRVDAETPAYWSVFDPDGVWLGQVVLPEGLEVFEIGANYVLGRWRDELEVEHIKVYELVKSPTGQE